MIKVIQNITVIMPSLHVSEFILHVRHYLLTQKNIMQTFIEMRNVYYSSVVGLVMKVSVISSLESIPSSTGDHFTGRNIVSFLSPTLRRRSKQTGQRIFALQVSDL